MDTRNWPSGTTPKTLRSVKAVLEARFKAQNTPLYAPYMAGMHLLRHVLPEGSMQPIRAETQREIIANSPQHRIEWLMPASKTLPSLYLYDGRAMYMGCAQYSCGGSVVGWDHSPDVKPFDRGKYYVHFAIPPNYSGPGILPVRNGDGVTWDWPRHGRGYSWCSCSQARMAISQGWDIMVIDARLLSNERWLAPWAGRLTTSYEHLIKSGAKDIAEAIRSVCLHTIGAMHRTSMATVETPLRDDERREICPDEPITLSGDGKLSVKVEVPREGGWKPWMSHPEWSAEVWSVAQYRVTKAMISIPQSSIVAVYGDALYTTEPLPAARKDEIGWLRLKSWLPGPVPTPRSWRDLREMAG